MFYQTCYLKRPSWRTLANSREITKRTHLVIDSKGSRFGTPINEPQRTHAVGAQLRNSGAASGDDAACNPLNI